MKTKLFKKKSGKVLIPVEGTNAGVDLLEATDDLIGIEICIHPNVIGEIQERYETVSFQGYDGGEFIYVRTAEQDHGGWAPVEGAFFPASVILDLSRRWTLIGPEIMPLKEDVGTLPARPDIPGFRTK
jgi:hypothetical protein